MVCLKFRGRQRRGPEAKHVIEVALANYVANSGQGEINHGLEKKPMLAFALCYIGSHLALDLLDESDAAIILDYCEAHLDVE